MRKKIISTIAIVVAAALVMCAFFLANSTPENDDIEGGNNNIENIDAAENEVDTSIENVASVETSSTVADDTSKSKELDEGDYERQLTAQAASENIALKDLNVLDRTKMEQAAKQFAAIYFDMSDVFARRMNLAGILDTSYIQEQGRSSLLYMDYFENSGQGYAVTEDMRYVDSRLNAIDNASVGNGIVRLDVTYRYLDYYQPSEDEIISPSSQYREGTVTYKIYLNDRYKVKDVRVAGS